jgi:fused signal recognition particle receptor
LTKTHDQLIGRLDQILLRTRSDEQDLLEELEEVLVTADLGVKTSYELLGEVQKEIDKKPPRPLELKVALRQKIRSMLDIQAHAFETDQAKPFVIMVVGVNGVGKTTTIGKLAAHLKTNDRKVMLVAADTFRAAAIEQLKIWSDRAGTDFIKHKPEADPSAVVYDAMQAAKSRGTDLVVVDTAGRLHTKTNLMEELKKVKRIMGREMEGAPHEILLVVDATTGQNAINQAKTFDEALGVTGIILTKLDGTAKGGVIVGIAHELKLPVRFIGIGEGVDDLREFDADLFLEAVFAEPGEGLVH